MLALQTGRASRDAARLSAACSSPGRATQRYAAPRSRGARAPKPHLGPARPRAPAAAQREVGSAVEAPADDPLHGRGQRALGQLVQREAQDLRSHGVAAARALSSGGAGARLASWSRGEPRTCGGGSVARVARSVAEARGSGRAPGPAGRAGSPGPAGRAVARAGVCSEGIQGSESEPAHAAHRHLPHPLEPSQRRRPPALPPLNPHAPFGPRSAAWTPYHPGIPRQRPCAPPTSAPCGGRARPCSARAAAPWRWQTRAA